MGGLIKKLLKKGLKILIKKVKDNLKTKHREPTLRKRNPKKLQGVNKKKLDIIENETVLQNLKVEDLKPTESLLDKYLDGLWSYIKVLTPKYSEKIVKSIQKELSRMEKEIGVEQMNENIEKNIEEVDRAFIEINALIYEQQMKQVDTTAELKSELSYLLAILGVKGDIYVDLTKYGKNIPEIIYEKIEPEELAEVLKNVGLF